MKKYKSIYKKAFTLESRNLKKKGASRDVIGLFNSKKEAKRFADRLLQEEQNNFGCVETAYLIREVGAVL